MVKVVIVNGMPESGKTTSQVYCKLALRALGWQGEIESSVDWVKEIALKAGWNGTKTDKNRKFLSDLKALLTEWDDAVLKHLVSTVDDYYYTGRDFVIFIDIREPEEIERAKSVFNATTLIVRRPQVECNYYNNTSDMNVFNYKYDYTIWNDRGTDELHDECKIFIDELLANDSNIYYKEENKL